MKPLLLCALLASPLMCSAAISSKQINALNDELEIMSGVIDTALKQNNEREGWRYRQLQTTYLASQGVVFTVSVNQGALHGFSFDGTSMRIPPIPPIPAVAPIVVEGGDRDIHIELDREWEAFAEEASRQVSQLFRESNSQLRDLRDRERELAWERRELERRNRDLNFELRQAEGERREEIQREIEGIEQELTSFAEREKELQQYATDIEKEQKKRLEKQKQARDKAYKQFLTRFESSIGKTLCRFGSGLRGLSDDENVSFVIKDFVLGEDGTPQDKIYVFAKRNIKACVQEKMDVAALLSSATSYAF
ncbi:hypothetical protein [Alteromonas halophila]|uniref:DUF3450 family protein n=1 Tax=Alteromonas halophila TaxID=516698 RepID=A0A918JIP5_9ALTE|nr:hypothetical protein [Alteromonas halophila]GGW81331.1 hypothetical protein GCM10007391_13130 [Alteromonas halophila]